MLILGKTGQAKPESRGGELAALQAVMDRKLVNIVRLLVKID
jgi:hypothetical protein